MKSAALTWHTDSDFIDRGKTGIDEVVANVEAKSDEILSAIRRVERALNDNNDCAIVYAQIDRGEVKLLSPRNNERSDGELSKK